jgi:hypothetical protein
MGDMQRVRLDIMTIAAIQISHPCIVIKWDGCFPAVRAVPARAIVIIGQYDIAFFPYGAFMYLWQALTTGIG